MVTVPLGILGDSDSHSYGDTIAFPPGGSARGGEYRAITLQWPEALARFRGRQLDLGGWGLWGQRQSVALLRDWIGAPSRAPRKHDFRFNLALTGAQCRDLMHGLFRQAPRLVQLMDENPEYWRRGVVVIRIGTNDFGAATSLERLARDPADNEVQAAIDRCLADIGEAVALIRKRHPQTALVLVGIFDNSHWAKYHDRWQSPAQLAGIARGLDRFDDGLRRLAAADPRAVFFDDRRWFSAHWGSRGADGLPAYGTVDIGGSWPIGNTAGDHPRNAVLQDGHAGLVWNTLWAGELLRLLNERFGTAIPPIQPAELLDYLGEDVRSAR